jgi:hypothetical protein
VRNRNPREVEVAGHNGAGGFVTFGDEIVQIFVGRRLQWRQPKVIDDEKCDAGCATVRTRALAWNMAAPSSSRNVL